MAEVGERRELLTERSKPEKNAWLTFFQVVSIIAGVSAALLAIAQPVAIVNEWKQRQVCFLALCSIAIEMGLSPFVRSTFLRKVWSCRGLFYAFVALVSLRGVENGQSAADIFVNATSYLFLAVALLYFVMGLFLMHRVYYSQWNLYLEQQRQRGKFPEDLKEGDAP